MLDQLNETTGARPRGVLQKAKPGSTKETVQPAPLAEAANASVAREVCVVEFRSGEAVVRHPDLKSFLDAGWLIESAVPQLSDPQKVELLVVLSKIGGTQLASDSDDDGRPLSWSRSI